MLASMLGLLNEPSTEKTEVEGEIIVSASPGQFAPGCAGRTPPQRYLVKFGGATMQGWRKYQEDRLCFMHLRPGAPPLCNSPLKSDVPSPVDIHMLFLSVFDGHGGSETSEYCAKHFHSFLRQRVEDRMTTWKDQHQHQQQQQQQAQPSGGGVGHRISKRRHSDDPASLASSRMNSFANQSLPSLASSSSHAATLPAHPLDSEFLTRCFLEFDESIPIPAMPTPAASRSYESGGMRRTPMAPPFGNNIPHLASGTTATVCIIDLANQHVVLAHIGDSRAIAFSAIHQPAPAATDAAATPVNGKPQPFQRMSPVSEEGATPTAGSSSGSSSSTSTSAAQPGKAARRRRGSGQSDAKEEKSAASVGVKGKRRRRSSGAPPVKSSLLTPSDFSIQYSSRDHHPDDPIEQQRIQSGHFASTFLNHQPPTKSRICHSLQRISLNVVRGFGDAHFKLESSAEQKDQMVCAVPDVYATAFPMAASAKPPTAATAQPFALDEEALQGLVQAQSTAVARVSTTPKADRVVSHVRTSSSTRTESPANSRSTTPVLAPVPHARQVALPPPGETMYIILASDGIWNSSFPPGTPGVSQGRLRPNGVVVEKVHAKSQAGAAAADSSARPLLLLKPSISYPITTDQRKSKLMAAAYKPSSGSNGSSSSADPDSMPMSDDEEEPAAPFLPADRASALALTQADDVDEEARPGDPEESDSDSEEVSSAGETDGGWSSSDDESHLEMQANLTVSQFFLNHAQPVVERRIRELTSGKDAAAAGAANAAAISTAVPPAPGSRRRTSRSRSTERCGSALSSASPVVDASSSDHPPPATSPGGQKSTARAHSIATRSFASIVDQSLDLLMAHPPLNRSNLKSTDNMSTWLVTITPIGVNTTGECPTYQPPPGVAGVDENMISSPPCLRSSPLSTARPVSSPSVDRLPLHPLPPVQTSSSAVTLPSTPVQPSTPKFFNCITPSLVQQRSLPLESAHVAHQARAASMPIGGHATPAEAVGPPASTDPVDAAAPLAAMDVSPVTPTSIALVDQSTADAESNAPTPFLAAASVTSKEDEQEPARMEDVTPPANGSAVSKKRRRTAAAAVLSTPAAETDTLPPSGSPPARLPSREEQVADLMFSDKSMHEQAPSPDTPATAAAAATPAKSSRKTARKRKSEAAAADAASADSATTPAAVDTSSDAMTDVAPPAADFSPTGIMSNEPPTKRQKARASMPSPATSAEDSPASIATPIPRVARRSSHHQQQQQQQAQAHTPRSRPPSTRVIKLPPHLQEERAPSVPRKGQPEKMRVVVTLRDGGGRKGASAPTLQPSPPESSMSIGEPGARSPDSASGPPVVVVATPSPTGHPRRRAGRIASAPERATPVVAPTAPLIPLLKSGQMTPPIKSAPDAALPPTPVTMVGEVAAGPTHGTARKRSRKL